MDARDKIRRSVDTLADAIKVTLGPRAETLLTISHFGSPGITKDGVTVAKEIDLVTSLKIWVLN